MIAWLVLAAVFKTVVPIINRELGSIPRRSRHLKALFINKQGFLLEVYINSLSKDSFFINSSYYDER